MTIPTHISFFEIAGGPGNWAAYKYQVDVPVTRDGYEADIQRIANAGTLPRGGRRPQRNPMRPERYLDIREGRGDGIYAYAFYLNAVVDGQQRLLFKEGEDPFPMLKMNAGANHDFLKGARVYNNQAGKGARWASFWCDLSAVRRADLATRIPDLPMHHPPYIMTIPFAFNVIDPLLMASPWVIPGAGDDDDGHGGPFMDEWADAESPKVGGGAKVARGRLTHGGIHPSAAAYLSVPL
ncbi:MAG TPA: hypothetical protein VEC11_08680 [Allosphingosinicella sp.]|nr:hypothetical protein [Allosphingosinicella sp.]